MAIDPALPIDVQVQAGQAAQAAQGTQFPKVPGFGEYQGGPQPGFRLSADKAFVIGTRFLIGVPIIAAITGATIIAVAFFPFLLPALAAVAAIASLVVVVALAIDGVKRVLALQTGPSTHHLNLGNLPTTLEDGNKVVVTKNGAESFEWKKRLIAQAEHTVVISGYCGKEPFDEVLQLIEDKMKTIPHFRAYLLPSDRFLTKHNIETLDRLKETYQDRFTWVPSSERFFQADSFKYISDHTKSVIIDHGRYMTVGGTSIEKPYIKEGTTAPAHPDDYDQMGFIERKVAFAMRDMDYVIHAPKLGESVHREFMKLITRWKHLQEGVWDETLYQLAPFEAQNPFGAFDAAQTAENVQIRYFATGPEHLSNAYYDEMLACVNSAQKTIDIANLYFAPRRELSDALIEASKRGVKIRVITNGLTPDCPESHYYFAERAKAAYKRMLDYGDKNNIELYEYSVPKTTFHKKVMVVDGNITFGGSSNIGTRSLYHTSDYEFNAQMVSEEIAAATTATIEEDILYSNRLTEVSVNFFRKLGNDFVAFAVE